MPNAMFETLESRQLLCGTTSSATAPDTEIVRAALVAKPAILGPSAVEGKYKGSATFKGGSPVVPLKLTTSPTSATLVVTGYGQITVKVTAAQFKKLRSGTFSFHGTAHGETLTLSGTVTDSGRRIAGSFSASGPVKGTGTFVLKKY